MTARAERVPEPEATPPRRRGVDASGLPEVVFGPKSVMWWGTFGFILIEGTTLGVAIGCYLYLSGVAREWPPPRTPLPGLVIPALKCALLVLGAVPATRAVRAAKAFRFVQMRRWVTASAVLGVVLLAVLALEFRTVGTSWDSHAYGSAVWLVLVTFALVLGTDVLDTLVFAAILWRGPVKKEHFSDAEDNSFYFYFTIVMGLLTEAVVTLVPRL